MTEEQKFNAVNDLWKAYMAVEPMSDTESKAKLRDAILGMCFEITGSVEHPQAWLRKAIVTYTFGPFPPEK